MHDILVHSYCLIVAGTKQSNPPIVKVSLHGAIRSFGTFPTSCGFGIEQRCLHNKPVDKTLRIMELDLTIQYLSLTKATV